MSLMKTIGSIRFRIVIIVGVVSLLTTGAYFASGGTSARGLSDWMVYASFFTLALGTLIGVTRSGTRVPDGGVPDDTDTQKFLREFFRASPFAVAVALAGIACFLVAVLVDELF